MTNNLICLNTNSLSYFLYILGNYLFLKYKRYFHLNLNWSTLVHKYLKNTSWWIDFSRFQFLNSIRKYYAWCFWGHYTELRSYLSIYLQSLVKDYQPSNQSLRAMIYKMVIVKNQGKFSVWLTKWKFSFSNFFFVFLNNKRIIGDHPYITSAYFWTFSDPPVHYVSMNTVLNVSKNGNFPNPPT